ncbi:MAG: ABC transporter permease [Gemmatimonadota bacterium]|jgi:putative ABC transport system permease protein
MKQLQNLRYRLRGLRLRLRLLLRREAVEEEMEEELRFHLEEEVRNNLRSGMAPREARRQAALAFGGSERVKEELRKGRGLGCVEDLAKDARHSLRQLRRTPVFATVAVLTLAIGIGANTGVFSVVNGLLLRDRPYRSPERLVHIYSAVEGESLYATSYERDLSDLRRLDDVFLEVGAFRGAASRVTEGGAARMVLVEAVTSNLFPLLGIEMALGRGFLPAEDLGPGGNPVVILGHAFWEGSYGGDPGVLGRPLRLAGFPFTIVGVAPSDFESLTAQGFKTDLFVPMSMARTVVGEQVEGPELSERGTLGSKIIARLRTGATMEQAQARADGLALSLRAAFPDLYESRSFHLHPSTDVAIQPDLDTYLMSGAILLLAAVGLVLLLACTNLAGFLLARGIDRRREIALRLALGAGRNRVVRQLLTESLAMVALGTFAGLLLARWSLDLLAAFRPPMALPLNIDTRLDGNVFLFTLAVVGTVGVLAALAPALQVTRPDVAPALKQGGVAADPPRAGARSGLLGIQMTISTILLVVGGLFVRSFHSAENVDPGFDTREAGLIWVDLEVSGVPKEEWEATAEGLVELARALPGAELVGVSNGVPLSEATWQADFSLPGVDPPVGHETHRVHYLAADDAFLPAMGIPVLEGRGITTEDQEGTEPVVLVNQAAARRFWPGEEALGKEVRPQGWGSTFRVVGVVRATKVASLREDPTPLFVFPRRQFQRRAGQLWLVARGGVRQEDLVSALRQVVREADPELVIVQAKTMSEHISLSLFLPRLGALLLGSFGLMALALATVGLYGVVSYSASRRTREVGIRIALGADQGEVIRMVVRDGMGVVLAGGLVGLGASLLLARLLAQYLIGIGPLDPVTLGGVTLALLAASAIAAFAPARRASRVSPTTALKAD